MLSLKKGDLAGFHHESTGRKCEQEVEEMGAGVTWLGGPG